ncbi:hypothetical protein P153DRAFT_423497 [Dothidotthia symphoricarpi CBS 119687]|uniref:C2H2-type domain-containing protein n=1 Tax=Dothidotthia symphoricarpi CBS 119687 TaxID=1392245 RepID=A0A6A6ADU3_9PLEO|nr:uncharacterized protein P153DRAFT_423497 [Dothidotthia symphoricarpi CBS 119687]KAF2129124.1 hypothetical protein P153DRAFT_423497 [Dothidotthia symphoricarpi CBS 119687]
MADSDYEFDNDDGSEDEYVGSKNAGPSTRAPPASKRQTAEAKEAAPKRQAWETEYSRTVEKIVPINDESMGQSVQEREEERKRKRLRKDTKPFQRGIIRHVVLVLDLSEAMMEKDMRPNRFITMVNYTQDYVREFFEQNPISQMSVLGMHDGIWCAQLTERAGAGEGDAISHTKPRNKRGHHRLWLVAISRPWGHSPNRQSLRARSDPFTKTNAGDEGEYTIATDQEMLKELLIATTTPPVVRQTAASTTAPEPDSGAALMMMGFPSRVVEDVATICACHGNMTLGGYTCSRCSAKVCSLPVTCPSCQLTLLLSTHLARSYHHLFPLRNWAVVSWSRAREKGSQECVGCLNPFPEIPASSDRREQNGETNGLAKRGQENEEEDQKASESARYECRACENHFCIDCDMFAHMVLHNCPGCLGRLDAGTAQNGDGNGNGDVVMSGTSVSKMVTATFDRLIRFEAEDGKTYYGDLVKEVPTREIEGSEVEVLEGDIASGFKKTGGQKKVAKLLSPLPSVSAIPCIGLNYRKHAEECNLDIPSNPAIFTKSASALTGPLSPISIHPDCQSQLDYEGELTIIIGKDAKNISAANALDYILGYTVGNDVSARNFQMPASVCGGQFGYAKSFDGFAPIGPCIASTRVIPDPQKVRYWTKVNGTKRQETCTDDMIFPVAKIVEHLSRGATLKAGTAIMTGTPSGVGLFMEPKGFVGDGDEVEVYVEGIGSLVNRVRFE